MSTLPFTKTTVNKALIEYHGKFEHTIGQIQNIANMSRIVIFYTTCFLVTQTMVPTIPGFQGFKHCIQYLASHCHKPIFNPYNSFDGSNIIRITWNGNQVEDYSIHIFL